jgi:hypothetical protein
MDGLVKKPQAYSLELMPKPGPQPDKPQPRGRTGRVQRETDSVIYPNHYLGKPSRAFLRARLPGVIHTPPGERAFAPSQALLLRILNQRSKRGPPRPPTSSGGQRKAVDSLKTLSNHRQVAGYDRTTTWPCTRTSSSGWQKSTELPPLLPSIRRSYGISSTSIAAW